MIPQWRVARRIIEVNSVQERIEVLEVKVAFQEDLLETLNSIVAEQQQEMALLRREMLYMHQRLRSLESPAVRSLQDEPPPPHY